MLNKKPKILVDSREPEEISDLLEAKGAEVEILSLEIGDYQISDKIIIERKTREDFEASIIDKRLFSQAYNLSQSFPRAVFIIEGSSDYQRIHKNAILGAYSSLISDFGCSVFFTPSFSATSEIIFAIASYVQLSKRQPISLQPKRKFTSLSSQQRAIVESLPNIGPMLARSLLIYFGTVENVFSSPESELMQVEKIGLKKAKELRKILTTHYNPDDDPI
jgi:Fanconi anemia group M protein